MEIYSLSYYVSADGDDRFGDVFAEEQFKRGPCLTCGATYLQSLSVSSVEVEDGREWPDLLYSVCNLLLASPRFISVLTSVGFKGFDIDPRPLDLTAVGRVPKKRPPRYRSVVVPQGGILPVPARTMGGARSKEEGKTMVSLGACITCGWVPGVGSFDLMEFVEDEASIGDREIMQWGNHVFITQPVLNALRDAKITNLCVRKCKDIGNTSLESLIPRY